MFLDLVGFGIIIPILPFYVRSFGVSDVFIGLLAASYSLMQFVFAPTLGRLSDEHGRKPVLVLSLAGNAVAWTLLYHIGPTGPGSIRSASDGVVVDLRFPTPKSAAPASPGRETGDGASV